MPQVPLTQNAGVARAPIPGVRVPTSAPIEAFGGGVAAQRPDLSSVTDTIQRTYLEERQKADTIAQTAFGADLAALETELTIQTKQRQGSAAFSAPEDVAEAWQKGTEKIAAGLTNEVQRQAFARMAAMHQTALNATVQQHVAAERAQYSVDQVKGYVDNEREAALASGTPDRVQMAVDNQKLALTKAMTEHGFPPEAIQQQVAKAVSDTHVAYIGQLVDAGQDIAADQYFAAHKSEILGSQLGKVQALTDEGSTLGQSRREAARIIQMSPTMADAFAEVEKIQNPKVADATETRLRRHYADVAASVKAEQDANFEKAGQILERTHSTDAIPRTMWLDGLSESQRITLTNQEEHLRTQSVKEGPGDVEAYLRYRNKAYFNPTAFQQDNVLTIPGLNSSQKKDLQDLQRGIVRTDVSDLQREINQARADVHANNLRIARAEIDKDADAITKWTALRDSAQTTLDSATHALDVQRAGGVEKPGTGPASGPSGPIKMGPPAPPPSAAVPLGERAGLTPVPKRPPTISMLQDAVRGGPDYIRYLDSLGIAIPKTVAAAQAALDALLPPEKKQE